MQMLVATGAVGAACNKATIMHLTAEKLGGLRAPMPPVSEQSKVVEFLDRETAEIDAFIADQEELIGLLAERRAATISHVVTKGVDQTVAVTDRDSPWFPVLPGQWELVAIRLGSKLIQTGPFGSQVHSDEYITGGVPLVNPMHLVGGMIQPSDTMTVTPEKATELERHSLQLGDVVVARRGELGRCAVTTAGSVGFLCGTGSAIVRLDPSRWVAGYFQLVFSSSQARDALLQYSIGSTMDNLNADVVGSLRIPAPPVGEQQRIVAYVEREIAQLDAAVADAREAIALSKERRAALVSAAVTGKIDVHGAA
jgi:type I restriction enzyme S subunit